MTSIGTLLFCTACGNLLPTPAPTQKTLPCEICSTPNPTTTLQKAVTTTSKPSAFPSSLRTKLRSDVQEVSEADLQTEATIRQTCEQCGCAEVRYYTQQLRSADEGSTVFYTCPQCGFKWNTNN